MEVSRTRHFGRAADALFLSQSAVSARIRQLEESVGVALLTRDRNNIQLTPAGQRLLIYAETILNTWNRARQEIAIEEESRIPLSVSAIPSLWDVVLQDWVHWMRRHLPDMVLQAEADSADTLQRKLREGMIDLAFLFDAPQTGEWIAEEIMQLSLALITSRPGLNAGQALAENYVLVDWGTSFATAHARLFPDISDPIARVGLGRIALAYILEFGGSAYLPQTMVTEHLNAGRLHAVHGAPVIRRTAYAVHAANSDKSDLITQVLTYFGGRSPLERTTS